MVYGLVIHVPKVIHRDKNERNNLIVSTLYATRQKKIIQTVTFNVLPRNTTQNMVFQVDSEPIADMN